MNYQFKINRNKIIKTCSYILINKAFNSDSILISLYTPPCYKLWESNKPITPNPIRLRLNPRGEQKSLLLKLFTLL